MKKQAKAKRIRRRSVDNGSHSRPYRFNTRMNAETSKTLASLQGLIFRYGHGETIADLFENVMMPALGRYCKPLAEKARRERAAKAKAKRVSR